MSQPSRSSLPPEAAASAAALLTLLGLVYALHTRFLLAMMGAVVVYVAVTLLTRKATDDVPPAPSLPDTLAELTSLSQKIAAHALRLQITEIVSQARALMNYLHESSDGTVWQDYVRDLLTTAVTGVRRFATRTPHLTDPDHAAVIKFSAFLAALSQTLDSVHQQVMGTDHTTPAAPIDTYQDTLTSINEAYLGKGR